MFSIYHAGSVAAGTFLLCASGNLRSSKQRGVGAGRQVPPRQLAAPTSQSSAPTNTIRQLDRTFPLVKNWQGLKNLGSQFESSSGRQIITSKKYVPLLSQQKPLKNSNRQSEPTLHRSQTCAFSRQKSLETLLHFWTDVGSGPLRAERRTREARREKFTRENFTLPTIHLGPVGLGLVQ